MRHHRLSTMSTMRAGVTRSTCPPTTTSRSADSAPATVSARCLVRWVQVPRWSVVRRPGRFRHQLLCDRGFVVADATEVAGICPYVAPRRGKVENIVAEMCIPFHCVVVPGEGSAGGVREAGSRAGRCRWLYAVETHETPREIAADQARILHGVGAFASGRHRRFRQAVRRRWRWRWRWRWMRRRGRRRCRWPRRGARRRIRIELQAERHGSCAGRGPTPLRLQKLCKVER